jgi:ATP-dependent exoDNAse (exonuclease V) alpha subunit
MTQDEALEILKMGRNVFITGAAGSGKTHLLNQYIKHLRSMGADVGITASTGIAATHMGGMTIHAWSGIGIRDSLSESDVEYVTSLSYLRSRIKDTKILIIDEISMLHDFRLDMVEKVVREIKNSKEIFGGMQVIFCGDFFQLPPVGRRGESPARFAYHSKIWRDLNLKICYLHEQFRQKDSEYFEILNAIRNNKISDKVLSHLSGRFNKKVEIDAEPTKLYSHNLNVDAENERELEKIKGSVFEYGMTESGGHKFVESLKKSCLAPETLKIKKGAKVMFVKNNFESGFANGTLGIVADCNPCGIKVRVAGGKIIDVKPMQWTIDDDGRVKGLIEQYPLRLAWAIKVHKSQGMSLDAAEVDLSQSFENGMGYVALSRVRSLKGLSLIGFNDKALKVSDEVMQFDKNFRELSEIHGKKFRELDTEKIKEEQEKFTEIIKGKVGGKKKKKSTMEETKDMFLSGKTIKEISFKRELSIDTVIGHLEKLKIKDSSFDFSRIVDEMPKTRYQKIRSAFVRAGMSEGGYLLTPAKKYLDDSISFEDMRMVRLTM